MKVISFITARTFMMNNALITFNDVSKKFVNGEHTTCVLDDVNLSIECGDFVSIVGRSGSGKSTLISLLGFLDIPTYGDYFYEGKNTSSLSQYEISSLRNKDFGFIFQSYNLISHLSVLDNVILPATYSSSFCLSTVTERANVLLDNLGLSSEKNKLPKQLSGGQQQRVSIARALINDPKVIIADEPTGALDKASSDVVLSVLKKLNRQGKTIILVTHDETLTQFSNKIFRFSDLGFKAEKTESSKSSFCEGGSCNVNSPPAYTRWFTSNKLLIKNTLQVLNVHRVRTILSMLGIVIGIMSLVIVTSIGNSAQLKIVEDLEKFGSRVVTLSSNYNTTNSYQLSDSQFQFLSGLSTVQYSSPIYKATVPINGVKNHDEINFVGVKNDYFLMNEMELLRGRYFHIIDVQNKKFVGLIDIATSDKLFNGRNPIGKSVFTDKKRVVIIGVINNKIGFTDPSQELKIYLPYTTLNNESESRVSYLFQPFKNADFSYATSLIEKYVTIWHGVDKFWVFNNDSARGTVTRITDTITSFVSIVALISLLVGGIGIMNVMLVSVYERTKEIGIRLSFGATTRHISIQFLIESVFICFLSAILGVVFSFLFIELFDFLYKDLEVGISIISIILAAFSSVFVGLIFGFAPAFKASKLSPMRALTT